MSFLTFLLVLLNSLFGCVCQLFINEYDDDDDEFKVKYVVAYAP